MLWTQSRLSHHIARMERRGLVTREQDPSDGRGAVVVLTEAGHRTIVQAAPAHVESVRRHLIDLLSDEQIDVLGTVADTVLHHLARLDAQG
ncbi:MAG: winged helix-turn-helix transcriptional regulator [Euzebyales bacterium]|jgi:DNA-binding MarR family transcriptional regulator|nr:winged helix-turn-helix transcriptional regulator [Euzebyales bacterium]